MKIPRSELREMLSDLRAAVRSIEKQLGPDLDGWIDFENDPPPNVYASAWEIELRTGEVRYCAPNAPVMWNNLGTPERPSYTDIMRYRWVETR